MNLRMGVFIKYVVRFGATGLKVSNDPMAGDLCLDADISVRMSRGTAGAEFEIRLYDLPERKVADLKARIDTRSRPDAPRTHVDIQLGYMDTQVGPVLDGICESIKSEVDGDKLVTTVKGREAGYYACATTRYTASFPTGATFAGVAAALLDKARFPPGCLETTPKQNGLPTATMPSPHFRSTKVLAILDELAERAGAELLIIDRRVFLGAAITYDDVPAATFDSEVNLAALDAVVRDLPGSDDDLVVAEPVQGQKVEGFAFTVLGAPALRPAQKVVVRNVKNYDPAANPEYRIRYVEHKFSSTTGYVCKGFASIRLADGKQARALDAAVERNAASAAREIGQRIRDQAFENPAIEVGAVRSVSDDYRAELYYGQPAPGNETQPSVNVPVKHDDDHVYAPRPIASAFAWRKCGLVTPVYAGMKAMIAHNRALASDGIVTGYLWSKNPEFAPPAFHQGDWWLCLPIDFDGTQPPKDDTSAVNDLTANDGRRVLELKGLKVVVGAGALRKVGQRPEPGADGECTLAHASGATITIRDGEISLDSGKGAKLTVTGDGITLTDGTVNVELKGGQLKVG